MDELKAILAFMLVRESVASVAISHDEDCDCVVCRAADDNPEALAAILVMMRRDEM